MEGIFLRYCVLIAQLHQNWVIALISTQYHLH